MLTDVKDLPGLNCGVCGFRTCEAFWEKAATDPELLKRCIHSSINKKTTVSAAPTAEPCASTGCAACTSCAPPAQKETQPWLDSLGRNFDFYLDSFPSDPGPREIIIPHNPMLTRELNIQIGDILIGRPLGMSCGCPVTHCGVVIQVDQRTGVMTWCVTGPIRSRQEGYKDLGYYIAEGYEGLVHKKRCELQIGMRYFFQPTMCMLQWRHSGLINYINRMPEAVQVRIEGLWIG